MNILRQHAIYPYLLFVLPVLLVSCAGMETRRVKYIRANPSLSVDIQNAIVHGELMKGMRFDDVRASWGKPDSVVEGLKVDNEEVARWIYVKKTGLFINVHEVTFVDGVISGMESYSQRNVYRYVAGENYDPAVVK